MPFTVIGVLDRKGHDVQGEDQDDVALAPLVTMRRHFVGVSRASPRAVHGTTVKFTERAAASEAMRAIADLLRERHRLQPASQ